MSLKVMPYQGHYVVVDLDTGEILRHLDTYQEAQQEIAEIEAGN